MRRARLISHQADSSAIADRRLRHDPDCRSRTDSHGVCRRSRWRASGSRRSRPAARRRKAWSCSATCRWPWPRRLPRPPSRNASRKASTRRRSVVDRAGQVLVMLRDERATAQTAEMARRKAYTALMFRTTTMEFQKRTASDPTLRRAARRGRYPRARRRRADPGGRRDDRRRRQLGIQPGDGRRVREGGHREGRGSAEIVAALRALAATFSARNVSCELLSCCASRCWPARSARPRPLPLPDRKPS